MQCSLDTNCPHVSVRREDAPNGELPSDDHADINRRHQTVKLRKGPSRGSSSLRVLRPQGASKHNRRHAATLQAPLAFRSLDPFRALREPDRRRRDEERPSRSEQKTVSKNSKQQSPIKCLAVGENPLDRKSP